MRRLLGIVLLTGAFLGGYYLGNLPGSPDVFDFDYSRWVEKASGEAREAGGKLADSLEHAPDRLCGQSTLPTGTIVEIGGKLYRVGQGVTDRRRGG